MTPLMYACKNGHTAVVKALINYCSDEKKKRKASFDGDGLPSLKIICVDNKCKVSHRLLHCFFV